MLSRSLGMSVLLLLVVITPWIGGAQGAWAEGGAATPTLTPRVTPTLQVIDLMPSNTTVRDTFLDAVNATTSRGTEARMKARTVSGVNYRPLIYFDLSTIPTSATIRSATLYLYMDNYSHMPDQSPRISLYRVKQDWAEMEATWNQRTGSAPWSTPGCEGSADREASESAYRVVSTVSAWYDWNITSPAQAWVTSPSSNHGMLLVSDNSREVRFYTSNDVDSRFHPHLRVEFTAGNPVPTATAAPITPGVTPIVTSTETPGYTRTPMPARVRLPAALKSWVVSNPTELSYDDGTCEGYHNLRAAAVRFSLTERRELTQLKYHLKGGSAPLQLVVYDANWSVLFRVSGTIGSPDSGAYSWWSYNVRSPFTAVAVGPGDFYVAMIWPSAGAAPHLGEDTTPLHAGRSYGSWDNPNPPFGPLDNPPLDLMIRAVVQ